MLRYGDVGLCTESGGICPASTICSGRKSQLTGIVLKVPAVSDLKVLKEAPSGPDALPFTPMDEILEHSYLRDLSQRIRTGRI